MSLVCYRNILKCFFCNPDETTNADCLTAITTEISGKDETWLVFISHGFTGSVDSDWLSPLRESILERYCLQIYNAAHLYG